MKAWLWSVAHGVVHLFMPFLPFAWMDRAHDWTAGLAFPEVKP